jgi:lysophospholipase L1-like esterase
MSLEPLHFLALGDSYTIGESVDSNERWPELLVGALRKRGVAFADPLIVAQTGWTTAELMAGVEQAGVEGIFDLVSLQIGVNNQYRGGEAGIYRGEFRTLLEWAVAFAAGNPGRVAVLSIPDWGVTPFAVGRDCEQISRDIDTFNQINRRETEQVGARYVDVTGQSRLAAQDPSLVAGDGLHPSAKMYAAWVSLALPTIISILDRASI